MTSKGWKKRYQNDSAIISISPDFSSRTSSNKNIFQATQPISLPTYTNRFRNKRGPSDQQTRTRGSRPKELKVGLYRYMSLDTINQTFDDPEEILTIANSTNLETILHPVNNSCCPVPRNPISSTMSETNENKQTPYSKHFQIHQAAAATNGPKTDEHLREQLFDNKTTYKNRAMRRIQRQAQITTTTSPES
jgi:hypothetical protein